MHDNCSSNSPVTAVIDSSNLTIEELIRNNLLNDRYTATAMSTGLIKRVGLLEVHNAKLAKSIGELMTRLDLVCEERDRLSAELKKTLQAQKSG
jgi:uncharacterized small protein (DUF1192 family)